MLVVQRAEGLSNSHCGSSDKTIKGINTMAKFIGSEPVFGLLLALCINIDKLVSFEVLAKFILFNLISCSEYHLEPYWQGDSYSNSLMLFRPAKSLWSGLKEIDKDICIDN